MILLEEVLVHLHDVAIGYDVPLIEDINIEVFAGDVIAVLGPFGYWKNDLTCEPLQALSVHWRVRLNSPCLHEAGWVTSLNAWALWAT